MWFGFSLKAEQDCNRAMSAACGKMVHFKITKSKQTWYLKYVVQKQKKKIENINEIKT